MINFIIHQFKKQKKDSVHQLLDIFYVKEYQENTNITSHTKKHACSIAKNLKILIEASVNLNDLNYSFVEDLPPNQTFTIQTNERFYRITTQGLYLETILNETEFKVFEEINETTNETFNVTREVPIVERELIGTEDIGLHR